MIITTGSWLSRLCAIYAGHRSSVTAHRLTECSLKWDLKDCEIVWVDLHIIVFALALVQLLSPTPTCSFSCRVADYSGGLWLKENHRNTEKLAHADLLVLLILFAAPLPVRSAEITMHNSNIHKFFSHVTNQSIYYSIRVAQGGSTEMSLSNTIKRFHGTHYSILWLPKCNQKKKRDQFILYKPLWKKYQVTLWGFCRYLHRDFYFQAGIRASLTSQMWRIRTWVSQHSHPTSQAHCLTVVRGT